MVKPASQSNNEPTVYPGAYLFPKVHLGKGVTVFPGAVIGRPPLSTGATTRQVDVGELPPVVIGENCVIGSNAVLYTGIRVGERSMVCDTACVREGCIIGSSCVIAMGVTINYNTTIGNRVKIMDNTHITGNMTIEDDVFIGMLVTTANDNAMGRKLSEGKFWKGRGPTIRRFATIGQGACLLPGIEIGENSIVGANSLVTRDVPARTLVAGFPARQVRLLTPQEIRS